MTEYSEWTPIDSRDDLNLLNQTFCWDEAELVEFYGCLTNEPYFPSDISRSGGHDLNVHLLVRLSRHSKDDPHFAEIVLIGCDSIELSYMRLQFKGSVDSLKRVYIDAETNHTATRCARLIYRSIRDESRELCPDECSYFKHASSVS